MADRKGDNLTLGSPFKGLSRSVLGNNPNYLYDMKNAIISKYGVAVRDGDKILDENDDSSFYKMFELTISGVTILVGVQHGSRLLYAYSEQYPGVKFSLSTPPPSLLFKTRFDTSTIIGFTGGTRFKLLESSGVYYIWSSSSEVIVIRKHGSILFGCGESLPTEYKTRNFDSVVDDLRNQEPNTSPMIFLDAFPISLHDKPEMKFIPKDDFYPVIPSACYIAETTPLNTTGVYSDKKNIGITPQGGVFSPFNMIADNGVSNGKFVYYEFPASLINYIYFLPQADNADVTPSTTFTPSTTRDFDPTATPAIDGMLVYVDTHQELTGTPNNLLDEGKWYYGIVISETYYDSDASPAVNVTTQVHESLDLTEITDNPVQIRFTVPRYQGLTGNSKGGTIQDNIWVWMTDDYEEITFNYTDNTDTVAHPVALTVRFHEIRDSSGIEGYKLTSNRFLSEDIGYYGRQYLTIRVPSVTSTIPRNELSNAAYIPVDMTAAVNESIFRGFVAGSCKMNCHLDTSSTPPVPSVPEVALAIVNTGVLSDECLGVVEERYHHEYHFIAGGMAGQANALDLEKHAIVFDGVEFDFFFLGEDIGDVNSFMRSDGYNLSLIDTVTGLRIFAKRGFNSYESSTWNIDVLAAYATNAWQLHPDGTTLLPYYAPFVSTKYSSTNAESLTEEASLALPISLRGATDMTIAGTNAYVIQEGLVLVGSSKTLTLIDTIQTRDAAILIERFMDNVAVFYDIGFEVYEKSENGFSLATVRGDTSSFMAVKVASSSSSTIMIGETGEVGIIIVNYDKLGRAYIAFEVPSEEAFDHPKFHNVIDISVGRDVYYIATTDNGVYIVDNHTGEFVGNIIPDDGKYILNVAEYDGNVVTVQVPLANGVGDSFVTSGGGT